MGIVASTQAYETINVRWEEDVCHLQIHRPQANNTINDLLVEECRRVLEECESSTKVLVLEGLPDVFCFGADFQDIARARARGVKTPQNADALYELWLRLACSPFVTVAHVRGKTNAGGVGFAAACDIVLCDEKATFSLSELLFGLMPACVLPFLIRRIGSSKANYMTLMTQPVSAKQALAWGLVDACEENSHNLLRKHLLRLRLLPRAGVARYKHYHNTLNEFLFDALPKAVEANRQVFSDEKNLAKIDRYIKEGVLPWESEQR